MTKFLITYFPVQKERKGVNLMCGDRHPGGRSEFLELRGCRTVYHQLLFIDKLTEDQLGVYRTNCTRPNHP